ncbi:hypothetical protein [Ehrlichia canis]|uniref:Uncharacterized protein n=1 Tax=Ehrlichia canis (strain Jake) TaxID=269484 RepID=A0ACA6AW09_EHRCJ|nr:hypothetical protein [Ehrlichia canis]AAZ68522.1 hypothetical protein Ecaj_0485 [Ehrlichia canis str. Jake]AUO54737.1 hypothetical protein C1I72_02410 [Ehrlichia canis]UKC53578.1 hypothetical protein s20019040002_000621 [Ehrlichia canis]UKC54516.1 hypothetical protein s20026770001_000622 [Ehrlichia canis]UKC55452.1 hypothetical protein s21009500007_000622 [Ehrlichia canis]
MNLILLVLRDNRPVLLPTAKCKYHKELERYSVPGDVVNDRLGIPNAENFENPYCEVHILYGVVFKKYNLVTSVSLQENIMFLFGENPVSGCSAFFVFRLQKDLLGSVLQHGLELDNHMILGSGIIEKRDISYEKYTKDLFELIKTRLSIISFCKQSIRTHMLSFFNEYGELFYTVYQNTVVYDTKTDVITNERYDIIRFK